ncbi:uncharacterized protein LOC131639419 [Vicia villosa]|uniref:uncharacterized protein LOC131639419 n=1 Tax=Vicia villosa TaxID=3911 RepID=UPI00273BEC0F|nr:uncharacterized protein LOC131639419 [Vicia villosa]
MGTLLGHGTLTKEEVMEVLITELGADPEDTLEEVERSRGAHVRCTQLFVDTNSPYIDVAYLRYLLDIACIHEYNLGGTTLAYNYHKLRYGCKWKARTMADNCSLVVGWILQHFPMIIGWREVPGYTEFMPRASAYILLIGNQVSDPYRYSIGRMVAEDIRYDCYAPHRETIMWDDIALYSGWLAASSIIIVRYLPERVMWQFGYCQTIPRDPFVSSPILMIRRQIDKGLCRLGASYVPDEAQATKLERDLSCADGYITWYFTVSQIYMIPIAVGSPSRPAH